ncbi:MAG: hypothetical protein WC600_03655 [Desulfobaccales bacterium]
MSEGMNKRELLKDKVVDLVKEFIKIEGGISQFDLEKLFGNYNLSEVSSALAALPICWSR